jgi:hypothetical protein
MNNSPTAVTSSPSTTEPLKERLQYLLAHAPLEPQRALIKTIAADLGTDVLSCAAALAYWVQPAPPVALLPTEPASSIKMVRYRLDVGSQHNVTLEELKKLLIEESGVDKNNINNVSIRSFYTLLELPDAMPADIFQHLKTVTINQCPLAIKRVKPRHKKRGPIHHRRGKSRHPTAGNASGNPSAD